MTTRNEAWKACQTQLALRLCGMAPTKPMKVEFNVQAVVDAVYWDVDKRDVAIKQGFEATRRLDDVLFAKLRSAFESAWAA